MKTRQTKLQTRFAPDTRYNVVPVAVAPFRATADTELELLKERLLREALISADDIDLGIALRRAANEAAAVAWSTPFPLLFFPTLFSEKETATRGHVLRQRSVRARSRDIVELVA